MISIADWLKLLFLNIFLDVEVLGVIFSTLYVVFAIKEKPSAWIFGGIGAVFYIFAYYENKFYADMSLQFYYVAISIYGFWNWKWGKKGVAQVNDPDRSEDPVRSDCLRVSSLSLNQWGWTVLGIVVCFSIYVTILVNFTDSPVAVGDSFTTAACIVATYLASKKRLENWLIFIVADVVAIGLYIQKEMYPTVFLFVIYTTMAVVGYWQWRKERDRL